MVQYYSPGVYIQEVETGPVPIQGVATSITGAVGVTAQGPTSGKPVLVTSFNDFQTTFGSFLSPPPASELNKWLDPLEGGNYWYFPLAVKGYFDNGGQQLYVKRVFSSQAQAAAGSLGQGLIADLSTAVAANCSTLQLAHLFGVAAGASVDIYVNGTNITGGSGSPTVLWYDPPTRTVGLSQAVGQALKPGRDFIAIYPLTPPSTTAQTLKIAAQDKGVWGNSIAARVTAAVGATLSILPDTVNGGPAFSGSVASATATFAVTVTLPSNTTLANNQTVIINNQCYTVTVLTGGNAGQLTTFTVAPNVSDGIQSLGNKTPVTIVPTSPGPNVTVNSQSIGTTPYTIAVPQGTAITNNQNVIINNIPYVAQNVQAGQAGSPGPPVVPPTPTTFVVLANTTDGLSALAQATPITIVALAGGSGSNTTVPSQSITAASPAVTVTVTLNSAMPSGVTWVAVQGRIFKIFGTPTTTSNGNSQFTINPAQLAFASWPANVAISSARKARVTAVNTSGDTIDIANASQLYTNALVEFDNGSSKEFRNVVAVNDVSVTFNSALTHKYFEGQKVRVLEANVNVLQYASDGSVATQESFSNLRLSYEADTSYLVNYVNQFSKLVNVAVNPGGLWTAPSSQIFSDPHNFPATPSGSFLPLLGGDDAMGALSVNDFVGVDGGSGNRTGIQALEDIDDIGICVVPGMWSTTIQSALVTFCETLADRFAILDPPDGLDIAGIQNFRAPLNSEYAALYYPWLVVLDPSVLTNVDVAPSAHMAGIYAQTDNNRGVFKAPANVPVAGIVKFAADVAQREQDVLNPIGINALRFFPNRGYLVWGARTLSSDTDWQYINVRRIFIYVEKSIQQGTQWVVFEPNDETTWSRVRQSVTDFLTTFWRSGGLQGTTAAQAFFVACDLGVTMTQDDINNGRMIVQVGIAPVRPAEFVIFQITQITQSPPSS